MSLEPSESELDFFFSTLASHPSDSSLSPEVLLRTIHGLLNVPKSFTRNHLPFEPFVHVFATALIGLLRTRNFSVVEDVFYFTPHIKGTIPSEPADDSISVSPFFGYAPHKIA